jgi:Domain of unknown function (DUF4189)
MRALTRKAFLTLGLLSLGSPTAYAAGAIAYSQDTLLGGYAYGFSHDYSTEDEAKAAALESCRRQDKGYNCAVVSTFFNACAALSVQEDDNGWAVQTDSSVDLARTNSRMACLRYGKACSVRAAVCDGTATTSVAAQDRPPLPPLPPHDPEKERVCRSTCQGVSDLRRIGLYGICMGARDGTDAYCYPMVFDMCIRECLKDGSLGRHHFVNGH